MQIFVETRSGKTIALDVLPSDTIQTIKLEVDEKSGIAIDNQILFFNDKKLADCRCLSFYDIESESTLVLKLE